MVVCPICGCSVREANINRHIDSNCSDLVDVLSPPATQSTGLQRAAQTTSFFHTPLRKSQSSQIAAVDGEDQRPVSQKRAREGPINNAIDGDARAVKKSKTSNVDKVAPLAERMRPKTLDDVCGQELVGPGGILRNLIETDRVPSMVLWGGPGTGKTTIARLIAQTAGSRFVEINSASTGVGEVKKIFAEAKNELSLTGRKTIVFCDEIHRFSKSQQDVFLGPVEAGIITLIGATTENPSFKVINALLSRCRTFTLAKLSDDDILIILKRATNLEPPSSPEATSLIETDDNELLRYLASFSDGDARTALNLLSLALDLLTQPDITMEKIKSSLTKTLVYDRAGDQHYDTISAFHKSVRGSDADAALYYLARMLQSGEDPLFIARRMVVIASEDVGLADNTMLPLATAAYQAAEKIGMPECRINLAHCCVALCLAPKSTRSYRGLSNAMTALEEPGVAGLPVPVYLRNAPTRLMKELAYGKGYKYNPHYKNGQVVQEYLPDAIKGRKFLEENDLGDEIDEDLAKLNANDISPPKGSQRSESMQHLSVNGHHGSSKYNAATEEGKLDRADKAGRGMKTTTNNMHAETTSAGFTEVAVPVTDTWIEDMAIPNGDENPMTDGDGQIEEVVYDEHDRSSMPDAVDSDYLDPDGG
ncbi:ATPase WRNIP1 [Sphaceloma murrayae]|uniref:ATPase WRNIP1 n=1 Tax=Sphaceloma murrayae TaxID=2082308 RepID=A0A2K1R165_9PEZI|nr:ATPase WRNIP1 [Sphaceloma murrayae]